ncbi:MAG: BtrH N-terminal domain-containing protein [Solirubrobacterales bacterium]
MSPPATMVPGYRHLPGNHCGSTALRNLLDFHGVEISEEMALGLGAGVCFYYVALDGQTPSRFTNGRVSRLEEQFVELTGLPLRLETHHDPAAAWASARAAVDSGRPALLLTDLYYLDHYGKSAHFPGHAVVLAGYDDELAYLSDTGFTELQTTRLENLAKARHGDLPIFPLAGHMLTVPDGAALDDPRAAAPAAIARNARQMLEPALGEYEGLPALRRFAAEVGDWPEQISDWQWCARFCYQVIERRGTGGGNFRVMYSRFLDEVGSAQAPLAREAAELWTALAGDLQAASETEEPEDGHWLRITEGAAAVLDAEGRLWPALAAERGITNL